MLNLFLSNRSVTFILIPLVLLVFWMGSFFQPLPEIANPTITYSFFYQRFAGLPFYNRLLGLLLTTFLSFFISRIFNANSFYSKENAVPSIVLVIMLGAWKGFHFFSPLYFSMVFLLLAIDRILGIYHQKSVLRELFDASFLIGLAALFYYPLLLFGLSIYGFLFISRPFSFRELILPVIGLFTPFYFLGLIVFLFDIPFDFLNVSDFVPVKSLLFESGLTQRLYLVITAIIFLFALFYLFIMLGRSKVQVQLSRKFLLILLVNGILIYWISLLYFPLVENTMVLVVPMALIIPFFYYEGKPVVKNIGFYFWLAAALLFDYIAI